MEERKLIIEYKNYLTNIRNYSQLTIKNYLSSLNMFLKFMEANSFNIEKFNFKKFELFYEFLQNKKLSVSSRKRHIFALDNFFTFLVDHKYIKTNPIILIKEGRERKKLPTFFTKKELKKIFKKIYTSNLDLQTKAIIYTLLFMGLRTSELINIKLSDINFERETLRICGKRDKVRYVFIHPLLSSIYKVILNYKTTYLFTNKQGDKFSPRYIQYLVKKVFKKLNITYDVIPYKFRHSFATFLLNETNDILFVKDMLGHSNIKTTEIYSHIYPSKIRKKLIKFDTELIKKLKSE